MQVKAILLVLCFEFVALVIGAAYALPITRCITEGVPDGYVVRELTRSPMCQSGISSPLPNALIVDAPSPGIVVCGG
jgi:hypothetical protein